MKRVLGLDLGTTSIGWALVEEAENKDEKSSIIRVGTRVDSLMTKKDQDDFNKGKAKSANADRTLKRGARRTLQRYKLRRENLKDAMIGYGWITNETVLAEQGNRTTFETLRLRAKAATQEITLEEFARVLLNINKKRGYKSNRKAKDEKEGQAIEGLSVANELHKLGITPGQFVYREMQGGKSRIPEFYQSDLSAELEKIWNTQKQFYPESLTDELKKVLTGKNGKPTWSVYSQYLGVEGVKRKRKGKDSVRENYEWRAKSVNEKIGLEELAEVFQDISGQIQSSTSYLGKISDRHKELYFNNMTVGQYMMTRLDADPNFSLKNTVFYRQDYIDEFDRIWAKQAEFHPELTNDRKKEISDTIIFYQRPLKSKKSLVDICEFENHEKVILKDGKEMVKTIGLKACPKASPLFQEFKVWQNVNNTTINGMPLTQEQRELLFNELNIRPTLSTKDKDVVRMLCGKEKGRINYREKLEGNRTNAALINAYLEILEDCGYDVDRSEITSTELYKEIEDVFHSLDYKTDFLHFDACLEGVAYESQPAYKLWHLIYSYEGDKSVTGDESLIAKIMELTGFPKEHAQILARLTFESDYGNLSSKAIRKIMPFLRQGYVYSDACEMAGYRHSKSSLTREELDAKELKDHLDLLPKNSLRNPVVEKILNQMVNVVNTLIDTYGKPDEIRVELARELKKSAADRQEMTDGISKAESDNKRIREILQQEFRIAIPSHNDIIRYKLYEELAENEYKTLYSNEEIKVELLFSGNKYDIEHIIPQAKLFDDSFSNKTLEKRDINLAKGDSTAYDFVKSSYGEDGEKGLANYIGKVENLFKSGKISKTKRERLLTTEMPIPEEESQKKGGVPFTIPEDFINRDLRETQYITKKAKSMLQEIVRDVVTTTGSVTDRLREDWQLVNVMQELNWDKYDKLGLTEHVQDKDGRNIPHIKDWTKRNDHRHHAMDALVIAFTKRSYIQYLNNLNARVPKDFGDEENVDLRDINISDLPFKDRQRVVRAIEKSQLTHDDKGKLRFIPPMPLDEFRREAKKQIAGCLVSTKAKNKVVTRNVNITKAGDASKRQNTLTPRGELHNATVYGKIMVYKTNEEKVDAKLTAEKVATVANQSYREALTRRLNEFGGDQKAAFSGKNSLSKNPIYTDESHFCKVSERVKTVQLSEKFTKRAPIDEKLNVNEVVDKGIRRILQARLEEYGNEPKKAFTNMEQNPIWFNREKGIQIKKVKVYQPLKPYDIHYKTNNLGNKMLDDNGQYVRTDYVRPDGNHHFAIFRDEDGNLQEVGTTFFAAVKRAVNGSSVIDKEYKKDEGWEFLFTMKQNEYFVFPNKETGFDPNEIDLMNPENYSIISPNLFRVQQLSTRNYVFRHHTETNVENNARLRNVTWKSIRSTNDLRGVVKVRVNHIGQIVQVGEY